MISQRITRERFSSSGASRICLRIIESPDRSHSADRFKSASREDRDRDKRFITKRLHFLDFGRQPHRSRTRRQTVISACALGVITVVTRLHRDVNHLNAGAKFARRFLDFSIALPAIRKRDERHRQIDTCVHVIGTVCTVCRQPPVGFSRLTTTRGPIRTLRPRRPRPVRVIAGLLVTRAASNVN